ncbi:MAG: conjugal transfer protein MobA [Rikenellaceae bacterium]
MRPKEIKSGAKPKFHRLTVRFDDFEYDRMLRMYEKSDCKAKAVFIKEKFFSNKFKVTTINNAVPEYYARLSDTHAQMRRIGNNYNQVVKELKFHFSERKALAMLYNLEKATRELVMTHREITALTKRYEQEWYRQW